MANRCEPHPIADVIAPFNRPVFLQLRNCQTLSPNDVGPVYEAWRSAVQQWQSKGGWENYNGAAMHDKRNSIRDLLKNGGLKNGRSMTISKDTNDFDILPIFVPSTLTTFQIKTQFKCQASVHADNPDFESEASKTRVLKHLSIQGIWAKDSSTQQMLDRSVMSHVSLIHCLIEKKQTIII